MTALFTNLKAKAAAAKMPKNKIPEGIWRSRLSSAKFGNSGRTGFRQALIHWTTLRYLGQAKTKEGLTAIPDEKSIEAARGKTLLMRYTLEGESGDRGQGDLGALLEQLVPGIDLDNLSSERAINQIFVELMDEAPVHALRVVRAKDPRFDNVYLTNDPTKGYAKASDAGEAIGTTEKAKPKFSDDDAEEEAPRTKPAPKAKKVEVEDEDEEVPVAKAKPAAKAKAPVAEDDDDDLT